MSVTDELFKECMGNFATGITVITTTDDKSSYSGLTVNSLSSISLDPHLLLFSLDKKYSDYKRFINSKSFAVSILTEEQEHISRQFASSEHRDWNEGHYLFSRTGCPIIKGCLAYFECETHKIYEVGDHDLIIGKVINLERLSNSKPLIYFRSGYNKLD